MSDYDWSKFTKRINVKASDDKIFRAWVTKEDLKVGLRLAEFINQVGDFRKERSLFKEGTKKCFVMDVSTRQWNMES